MENTVTIYRGTAALSDGANALINGFPLTQADHALSVFPRANAAQMAVLDLGTKATAVTLEITRQFATEAEAKDHAQRAPQTGTGQYELIIEIDDGTDVHTWTLSDQDGGGAAWKSARTLSCSGLRTVVEYSIEGGTWTYDGPLDSTYSDAIPDAQFNSALCNVLNSLLARVPVDGIIDITLQGTSFAGTVHYPGATLSGTLNVAVNTALNGFAAPSLTSVAGILNLGGCTAMSSLSIPLLASVTGTVNLDGCAGFTSFTLPASIASANGFDFIATSCALNTTTVNAILDAFNAGKGSTTSGLIALDGGTTSAPTGGSGRASVVALRAAGITVNIN